MKKLLLLLLALSFFMTSCRREEAGPLDDLNFDVTARTIDVSPEGYINVFYVRDGLKKDQITKWWWLHEAFCIENGNRESLTGEIDGNFPGNESGSQKVSRDWFVLEKEDEQLKIDMSENDTGHERTLIIKISGLVSHDSLILHQLSK